MQPSVDVLGLSIKTFGVFFALNFVAWGLVAARRLRELGKPTDWAYELVFWALIGGLIGARGYYLLQNHRSLSLGDVFGGSGLIWYGGLLGGAGAGVLWGGGGGFPSPAPGGIGAPGPSLRSPGRPGGCPGSGGGGHRQGRAGSGATATRARQGTGRGRWAIRTERCRPPRA